MEKETAKTEAQDAAKTNADTCQMLIIMTTGVRIQNLNLENGTKQTGKGGENWPELKLPTYLLKSFCAV